MLRLLILASMCAIINASILPNYMLDYPRTLQSLFGTKREAEKTGKREVCKTKECHLIANIIKESMDETVDPCDDFYEYACGNWSNANPSPENASSWSMWDMVSKRIEGQIKGLIQNGEKPNDLFAVKLAKKWYHSCMDEENIEKRGVEPLLNSLWRHGGWPMIMEDGEWDDVIYRWQIVDDQYGRLLGTNAFYDVQYGQISWEGDPTILIMRPHLPSGVRRLISYEEYMELQMGMDASDENNESGEGSQEKGSREEAEQNETNEEKEEDKEEDEEDNEVDDEESEEKLQKKKVAIGHRRRLGHGNRRHNNKKVANSHSKLRRKRVKRNIMDRKLLHKLLHQLNKANKHKAHGHVAHSKLGHKGQKLNAEKNRKRERIDETGEENKKLHKKRVMKKKIGKRLSHGHRKSAKHEAMRKKSKTTEMKGKIQGKKHHMHQKINNHRVHHAVNKISESDVNEEDNNDIDETNEEDTEEKGDDEKTDEEDNDDNDEEDNDDNDEEDSDDNDDDYANDETEGDDEEDEDDDDDDDDEDEEDEAERVKKAKEEYRQYVLNVSLILSKERGIEVPREQMLKDIDDMIDFIIKLTHIMILDDHDDQLLNTTLTGLQEKYESWGTITPTNKINWVRKVEKLFYEADVDIDDDAEVIVTNNLFFEKLNELLSETPKRVIVNYVHWLFIETASMATVKELVDLSEQWEEGYKRFDSREELCLNLVQLTNIAGYQYVQEYLKEDIAKAARDMIDDIQKEVEYQIEESKWISEDTKHFVLDKLVHMKNWVGYPDWYRNTTIVKRYFQGLTIGPSFYENILNYMRYRRLKNLRRALQFTSDDEINDMLDPLELNAFFMPTENSISITAADLQNPFFSPNRPWYVNFGIVGLIMGHEVNHGFDDQGHLFDKDGNRMEWLTAMADAYNKRAKCFVDQYNKYPIIKGNNFTVEDYGNQTIGENIADTMGLHAVFRAYKRRERECGKEDPALPGLEQFSNNQMFFLSFANMWCETENEAELKMQARFDVHSTSRLRVIGPVSNSEEFAKAFKCPVGSRMNPANKCNIWE